VASVELLSFSSDLELASAAASRWLDTVAAAADRGTSFHVALPGGRIVRRFFDAVVEQARLRRTNFSHLQFFWGDERCVPPDDPESNFGLARKHLLAPLAIPPAKVHRVLGEGEPSQAASEAEREVRRLLPLNAQSWPIFDLVLLGLGEDGHVASLFPDLPANLAERPAVYFPVVGPKPPPRRITLGFAVLAVAREVWVLASGAGKQRALQESLAPGGQTPLARLLRRRTRTLVFTDLEHARPPAD
jgi:6-phosphogluconolactonase